MLSCTSKENWKMFLSDNLVYPIVFENSEITTLVDFLFTITTYDKVKSIM